MWAEVFCRLSFLNVTEQPLNILFKHQSNWFLLTFIVVGIVSVVDFFLFYNQKNVLKNQTIFFKKAQNRFTFVLDILN